MIDCPAEHTMIPYTVVRPVEYRWFRRHTGRGGRWARRVAMCATLSCIVAVCTGCGRSETESRSTDAAVVFNVDDALLGAPDTVSAPGVRCRAPKGWLLAKENAARRLIAAVGRHPLCDDSVAADIRFTAFTADSTAFMAVSTVNVVDTAAVRPALEAEGGWYARFADAAPVRRSTAVFPSGRCLVRQLMVQTGTTVAFTMMLSVPERATMTRVDFLARRNSYPQLIKTFESFVGTIVNSI